MKFDDELEFIDFNNEKKHSPNKKRSTEYVRIERNQGRQTRLNRGNSMGPDNVRRNGNIKHTTVKHKRVSAKQRKNELLKALIPTLVAITILIIVVVAALKSGMLDSLKYSSDKKNLFDYLGVADEGKAAMISDGELLDTTMLIKDGKAYLPMSEVKENYCDRFYYDVESDSYLYTRASEIDSVKISEQSCVFKGNVESFDYVPIIKLGDTDYMAIDFLKKYYNLSCDLYGGNGEPYRLCIKTAWGSKKIADINKKMSIRVSEDKKSACVCEMQPGDKVYVVSEGEEWTKVLTEDLLFGYIENKFLGNFREEAETPVNDVVEDVVPFNGSDEPVILAWNNVMSVEANSGIEELLAKSKGVNVISPTWFTVVDDNGTIESIGSKAYVDSCHARGVKVWGLFDNLQHLEVSSYEIFSKASKRADMIATLMSYADKYNLDGINLDIESIPSESGEHFVQFMRELSIACRERSLVLSVDNYVPLGFNDFYNRKEQGVFADYVVIMGYDEHYTGSKVSGSVASIGYVKDGMDNTLAEVPANKIINAVPLYTRMWTEIPKTEEEIAEERAAGETEKTEVQMATEDASLEATQEDIIPYKLEVTTLAMGDGINTAKASGAPIVWDEETAQNYAEWKKGANTNKIWLEDEDSLRAKLDAMKERNIAGVAAWQIVFAEDYVWDLFREYYGQ